jgi:tetratricopeptide (TPR) repeat protein
MTKISAFCAGAIRVAWWPVLIGGFAVVVIAAPRKPRRQENAPEIRAQIFQQQLSNPALSPDQRARLSIDLAIADYQMKDFQDEADVLEGALAVGVTNATLVANANYYLGRTYEALGENEQAVGQFDIVWQHFSSSQYSLNAAMELGDLTLQSGDAQAAAEWYHTIIDQQPTAKLAFLARDKLRAMSNGVSAAEITDESHRPVYLTEQLRRLDQYLYSQLYDKADTLAQELVAGTTNAAARNAMSYHLTHHYWMYGYAEGAQKFLASAVNTTGNRHVQALILAGHIERALGQTDAALGYYQQAIVAAPAGAETITAYQQSTRLLLRSGREADGLALAAAGQQAFALSGKLPAYLYRISGVLRDRGDSQWPVYATQMVAAATNELARTVLMQLANDARLRRDWADVEGFYNELAARPSKSWRSNVDAQIRLLEAQLNQTNSIGAAQTDQALQTLASSPSTGTNQVLVTTQMSARSTLPPPPGSTINTGQASPPTSSSLPTDDARAYTIYRLGKIWLVNGQTNNAIARWQLVLSTYPSATYAGKAQVQLAELAEANGNLTNAAALYQAFLSRADTPVRYQLRVYADLIRIEEELGDTANANLNLQSVQAAALQSGDAELQLNIAQYLWQHSDKTLANQLLQVGLTNAVSQVQTVTDPHKRLWWEYLVARRLDAFYDYGQLAQYVGQFQPDFQNKALNDWTRYASYYLLIRAMERTGQIAQAQALCQNLVSSLPDDSAFVGHILYRMSQEAKVQGDAVSVRNLAIAAFQQQPTTSHFAQLMYLETATEDFNAGNYADALAKVSQLQNALPMSSDKDWAAHFRWDCQYVEGRCLVAQGNTAAGQPLVTEALAQKPVLPYVVHLVEPASGTP